MKEEESIIALLPMDLEHLSIGALRMLARDPNVDTSLLQKILIQEREDAETVRCLIRNSSLPDEAFDSVLDGLSEELRQEVAVRQKALVVPGGTEPVPCKEDGKGAPKKAVPSRGGNIQKRIETLSPGEKIAFALKGPKEARGILIRDSNKEVALTVLKNPKMTESEVEFYAACTNVVEDIHRLIGKNREWCRKYAVLRALVFNPKTPVGVSVGKLALIKDKDLVFLSKSKNVPNAISAGAKRLIAQKSKKKG
jgi:hypothetical protein